jgi:small subunit ribosomal protein S4
MKQAKCKISRRLGVPIFSKCAKVLSRRPYPPGYTKRKRRPAPLSEYGKELREKQKLKYLYNLRERQFRNYVKAILAKRTKVESAPELLIQMLERRLDNVVFRLGFAKTRQQARQLVAHGHFLVNGRKTTIPSQQLKTGDEISIRQQSLSNGIFRDLKSQLKNYNPPSWLTLDKDNFTGKVIGTPSLEEVQPPAEISPIFEFYSR